MTTPGRHTDVDITADRDSVPATCAPTPHDLTINPDLSSDDINIGQPTPFDLGWTSDPDLSQEDFKAEPEAGI